MSYTRKKVTVEDFIDQIILEIPSMSAGEMELAATVKKKYSLETDVESELTVMRLWFVSHALMGALTNRARIDTELALETIARFLRQRDKFVNALGVDYRARSEFYDMAYQEDILDEGNSAKIRETFFRYLGVGRELPEVAELFNKALANVSKRVDAAVTQFEIIDMHEELQALAS